MPAFFGRLGLVEGKRLLDANLAIALLRYLGFGQREYVEWDLALEKILCGIPLSESIATTVSLEEARREAAEQLLRAVIANWGLLRGTSPDGLREGFLQRDGSLREVDGFWRLLLSRKAQDVLLDRLPWTISMIQLPWMLTPLRMDWADGHS